MPTYQEVLDLAKQLPLEQQLRLVSELSALAATLIEKPNDSQAQVLEDIAEELIEDPYTPESDVIISLGIDPARGKPRYTLTPQTVYQAVVASTIDQPLKDLATHYTLQQRKTKANQPTAGLAAGYIHNHLDRQRKGAGWALVFPATETGELLLALWPLFALRCEQQQIPVPPQPQHEEALYRWIERIVTQTKRGTPQPWINNPSVPVLLYDGTGKGETYTQWLSKYDVSGDINVVDPTKLPFYLLLVGRPEARSSNDPYIPFDFQLDLDIFWGVGRLCFTDENGNHRIQAYRAYAEHVVHYEQGKTPPRERTLALFGPRHELDHATTMSHDVLLQRLITGHQNSTNVAARFGFQQHVVVGEHATRNALLRILNGHNERPAILFTASHGLDCQVRNRSQHLSMGALVCAEWNAQESVSPTQYVSADSLDATADLRGMVAFLFACFSVGYPKQDQFVFKKDALPRQIAPYAMISQLPQQMLERGALAVIGHVDRAWTYSFRAANNAQDNDLNHVENFEDVLGHIMQGNRIGEAMDKFAGRQGMLGVRLNKYLQEHRYRHQHNPEFKLYEITRTWIAFQDARYYIVLGDPAVQVQVDTL